MTSFASTPAPPSTAETSDLARDLVRVALDGLPRMVDPESGLFSHTRVMQSDGSMARRGTSLRYTAIVLLGASRLPDDAARSALGGLSADRRADAIVEPLRSASTGDLALGAWALAALAHPAAVEATCRLAGAVDTIARTVDLSWAILALTAARRSGLAAPVDAAIATLRSRLLAARHASGLFAARPDARGLDALRGHVACFADQVYPIVALAELGRDGDAEALDAAAMCAKGIVTQQGQAGQWWWHYDVRTGGVVEHYPVYAVHQSAMGPMALRALADAGGPDQPQYRDAIARSLRWLSYAPEIDRALLDAPRGVVWRKVGRTDRLKAVRAVRAATTRIDAGLRLPWIDALARPEHLDRECRPYHLGWILYCWADVMSPKERPCAHS